MEIFSTNLNISYSGLKKKKAEVQIKKNTVLSPTEVMKNTWNFTFSVQMVACACHLLFKVCKQCLWKRKEKKIVYVQTPKSTGHFMI